jgi:putative Holliday junction resolvase
MAKLLGLDIGTLRIGVALAESSTKIVSPFKGFKVTAGVAQREILRIIQEQEIMLVVAGLPLDIDGNLTPQVAIVQRFCRRLRRRQKQIEIVYVDEFLTSKEAEQRLKERGGRHNADIDALAASIILENYLALRPEDAAKLPRAD